MCSVLTLNCFCGRRNPKWILGNEQANEIYQEITKNPIDTEKGKTLFVKPNIMSEKYSVFFSIIKLVKIIPRISQL